LLIVCNNVPHDVSIKRKILSTIESQQYCGYLNLEHVLQKLTIATIIVETLQGPMVKDHFFAHFGGALPTLKREY
jgi:hypothetical protein